MTMTMTIKKKTTYAASLLVRGVRLRRLARRESSVVLRQNEPSTRRDITCRHATTTTTTTTATTTPLSSVWDSYSDTVQGSTIRDDLPEVQATNYLTEFLLLKRESSKSAANDLSSSMPDISDIKKKELQQYKHLPSRTDYLTSLDSSMATMALHVNARIAALVGKGFYTIGPCGEESLSTVGTLLQPHDSSALHYRHTSISFARQLKALQSQLVPTGSSSPSPSDGAPLHDLLLGRARGYTVSKLDPVTGGVHCSIGGGENEFVVSSTLASQCPSAVGRALGYPLIQMMQQHQKQQEQRQPISFVTIGDGSLHNHHFLSSLTLAKHAKYLNIKCPIVFGISDNGFSISYRTHQFVEAFFRNNDDKGKDPLCAVFHVNNGGDMLEVYDVTKQAFDYARAKQAPSVVLYKNLSRRFGHASTDRQHAYMSPEEIARLQSNHDETCVLQKSFQQAVEVLGYTTYEELYDRWNKIQHQTELAFQTAIDEPKVTLPDMMNRVSVPLTPIPTTSTSKVSNSTISSSSSPQKTQVSSSDSDTTKKEKKKEGKPQVMRKHMTRVIREVMDEDDYVVYLGEDVRHGGYYLVTDGLAQKYPHRVLDFPPDETTLLGAALGFSQLGLTPIVEIPYAKYLDCGVDMFYEIAIQHWLTSGGGAADGSMSAEAGADGNNNFDDKKRPSRGMVVRLQGFDRGVFGGNFHTHNSLAHIPPGIDIVCFSNGNDYVRGFRHAIWQAKHGRIVMLVDCTNLLNLRHIQDEDRDRAWEFMYPLSDDVDATDDSTVMMGFDQVIRYRGRGGDGDDAGSPFIREKISEDNEIASSSAKKQLLAAHRVAIITYGNGVVTALQARKGLVDRRIIQNEDEVDIIDCPYLSDVPKGLENILVEDNRYDHVLFADICKEGPGSNMFSSMITALQQRKLLPNSWAFVGAPRTYNPLGSTVTFLNSDTIEDAVLKMLGLDDDNEKIPHSSFK